MFSAHTVTSPADLMPAHVAPARTFTVTPRVLGGFRLRCFEDGVEVFGGVFDTGDDWDYDDATAEGQAWLSDEPLPSAPPEPAANAQILLHRDDGAVFPCDTLSEALWLAEVLWPHGYLVSLFDCGSVVVSEIPCEVV